MRCSKSVATSLSYREDRNLIDSFFLAGFECSAHRRADGRRLDLLEATDHARLVLQDYTQIRRLGLRSARDGLRWHLIEKSPGQYDWSSFLPMLRAAETAGVQVIWDLCHYGWPDWLDVWSPEFVERFAAFSAAAARLIASQTDRAPVYCPVNEISYWAWAGGETGRINPCAHGRGGALKRQLVRAVLAATEAIRRVDPRARFMQPEPLIHVASGSPHPRHQEDAEQYRLAQYEAFDMLAGGLSPELGGLPDYLDIVGVNYYPDNQWYLGGSTIPMGHHAYRPLRDMLGEIHARYGRPLLIAETGAEGGGRPYWLHYVCGEVAAAMDAGVPIEGICLYPILDYPGWENDRICDVGLLTLPDPQGKREVDGPLLEELKLQQTRLPPRRGTHSGWMDRSRRA